MVTFLVVFVLSVKIIFTPWIWGNCFRNVINPYQSHFLTSIGWNRQAFLSGCFFRLFFISYNFTPKMIFSNDALDLIVLDHQCRLFLINCIDICITAYINYFSTAIEPKPGDKNPLFYWERNANQPGNVSWVLFCICFWLFFLSLVFFASKYFPWQ